MESSHILLGVNESRSVDKAARLIGNSAAVASLPQLIFPLTIFQELNAYYRSSTIEFQLMGLVEQNGNEFTVTEIAIPRYASGLAHAELDQDMFPAFLKELEDAGKDVGKLRFQAHSHGKFDAYFSGMDIATIREAYACDWMISMVGNMKGDFKARLDIFAPMPLSISLPIAVVIPHASRERQAQLVAHLRERGGRHHG